MDYDIVVDYSRLGDSFYGPPQYRIVADNADDARIRAITRFCAERNIDEYDVYAAVVGANGGGPVRTLRSFSEWSGGAKRGGWAWEIHDYEFGKTSRYRTDSNGQGLWGYTEGDGWHQSKGHMQWSLSGATPAQAAQRLIHRWELGDEREATKAEASQ